MFAHCDGHLRHIDQPIFSILIEANEELYAHSPDTKSCSAHLHWSSVNYHRSTVPSFGLEFDYDIRNGLQLDVQQLMGTSSLCARCLSCKHMQMNFVATK